MNRARWPKEGQQHRMHKRDVLWRHCSTPWIKQSD